MSRNDMTSPPNNYDDIAADFAKMRNEFYKEQKYLDLFIQHVQPRANILDVGCGSGHPIATYLTAHKFSMTGIDASKELLKIAKKNCPEMKLIHGDMRTIKLQNQYDGIIEWWSLFHVPKNDHELMIKRFANWLKIGGILEFTTGDHEYQTSSNDMLNHLLWFYSEQPTSYEKYLKRNGFEILLRENDQEQHLVWIAKKVA